MWTQTEKLADLRLLKRECNLYRVHFGLGSNKSISRFFQKTSLKCFYVTETHIQYDRIFWSMAWIWYTYLDLILVFDARKYEELWIIYSGNCGKAKWILFSRQNVIQHCSIDAICSWVESFLLELGDQSRRKQVFDAIIIVLLSCMSDKLLYESLSEGQCN